MPGHACEPRSGIVVERGVQRTRKWHQAEEVKNALVALQWGDTGCVAAEGQV